MKTYQISDDRLVVVKKKLVTIKQKDSDKSFEFTPSKLVLSTFVTKYCISRFVCIGGMFELRCVDFRKWFQPRGQKEPKPTRKGIAQNLDQWVRMRKIVEAINNDHPVLAAALPCYMEDGHLATFECRECYPFLKLA